MDKIKKLIIALIIVASIIGLSLKIRAEYIDHLIIKNATLLNSYTEFDKAAYKENKDKKLYKITEKYLENTNIQVEKIMRKQNKDKKSEYYMVVGTKEVPQLILKLEANMSDLGSFDMDSTNEEVLTALKKAGDDKYTLSALTGDNIITNQKDISNTFVEIKFTLKSLMAGGVDLKSFSAKGKCISGSFDISDETKGDFVKNSDSCQEIFKTIEFKNYLEKIFL